jgi:hypothetical protein
VHNTGCGLLHSSVWQTATLGRTGWWAESHSGPVRGWECSRRALSVHVMAGKAAATAWWYAATIAAAHTDGRRWMATTARGVDGETAWLGGSDRRLCADVEDLRTETQWRGEARWPVRKNVAVRCFLPVGKEAAFG